VINSNFDIVVFKELSNTSFSYLIVKCFSHFWANVGLVIHLKMLLMYFLRRLWIKLLLVSWLLGNKQ